MQAKQLWIAALGIALGGMILEGAWRLFLHELASPEQRVTWLRRDDLPATAWRFTPDAERGHVATPRYWNEATGDRHDAHGFRGPDRTLAKPDGVYRIICAGSSATYGTNVARFESAFPARLERILHDVYGHEGIEVVNAGVAHATTTQTLADLERRVLPMQPDLVVIATGDADVDARLVPPARFRAHPLRVEMKWPPQPRWWDRSLVLHTLGIVFSVSDPARLLSAERAVTRKFERPDLALAWLAKNRSPALRENLAQMAARTRAHDAAILLATAPHPALHSDGAGNAARAPSLHGLAEHNEQIRQLASEGDLPFFDLAARMPAAAPFWSAGGTLTADGYEKMAALFAAHVDTHVLRTEEALPQTGDWDPGIGGEAF